MAVTLYDQFGGSSTPTLTTGSDNCDYVIVVGANYQERYIKDGATSYRFYNRTNGAGGLTAGHIIGVSITEGGTGSSGGGVWGTITGTLSDQTDLNAALGAGVADGDKGDVTVSASGATWTVDAITEATVTFTDITTNDASTTKHGYAPKAVAPAAGLVSALAIANGETVYTNKALYDTTNPAALGTVGPGTAVVAARRDHIHAMPALGDLTDVGAGTPTNKFVPVGDGDSFECRQLASTDLSDTSVVTGANDDFLQMKDGVWSNRTIAQVKTDLAASTTTAGVAELAINTEVDTGSDATRAVTPDALAGSSIFGVKSIVAQLNGTTALTTSEKVYFRIPPSMNGMNLVSVRGACGTGAAGSSSSGTPTFTVKNVTDNQQMLSTSLTIDAGEYTSATAAAAVAINATYDDVATDDLIEIAVTAAGTGVTYATVTLGFQLP